MNAKLHNGYNIINNWNENIFKQRKESINLINVIINNILKHPSILIIFRTT